MARKYEVIGKKAYTSSNSGKTGYTYYFASDFKQNEIDGGDCEGRCTLSEFSYTNFNVIPGDIVELEYDKGYQDKAVLENIEVVQPATPFKDKPKEQK